ncbi:MAG: SLBB domain-containing protein [Pyrinomonadaceae bacterium]|nr:SLBB domain-containing protein [Pyrinomonadaceae bacterium]MBP6212338.1 SLBB domain-containing protein [Pyrinomonadaceae bacterium]
MKSVLISILTLIFTAAVMVSAQMPVATGTPDQKGYMIGPGDEVTGKVLGEPQYDFVATVDEDGRIEVPFFDKPVMAKCRSERELRTDIISLLAKYLRDPKISIRVTERKSRPPATIYGEVNKPQEITLMRKATLVEILAVSGGVKDEAGGMIQVFRTRTPLCSDGRDDSDWKVTGGNVTDVPSRMYSLASVKLGKEEANPIIYPGDVIVVQKASPVYITGEVVAPQGIYLKEDGLTLTEAIAKIGGVRREAKTKDIKIYRLKPNSKEREIIAANYDLIKKGEQKDVMLEPYDIIEVDKAKKSIGQTILDVVTGAARAGLSSVTSGLSSSVIY